MGKRKRDPIWVARLREEIEGLTAQNQRLKARTRRLRAEKKRWAELAHHDSLTGLLNRRGFKERLGPFLKEAKAFKSGAERRKSLVVRNLALIEFDVDHFKQLNDVHGHGGGDAVLQAFAGLLTERARGVDLIARWGGEEFVVCLIGSSKEEALEFAEEIRERAPKMLVVWHPRPDQGRSATFTVSAGVTDLTTAHDLDEIIEQADAALFRAKQRGRNRIVVHGERGVQASIHLAK